MNNRFYLLNVSGCITKNLFYLVLGRLKVDIYLKYRCFFAALIVSLINIIFRVKSLQGMFYE